MQNGENPNLKKDNNDPEVLEKEKNQKTAKDRGHLDWKETEDTLAAFVHKEKLTDIFWGLGGKKLNVFPGEAALITRNGKIEKIVEEGNVVFSGVLERFKKVINANDDLGLMMIDTSGITLRFDSGMSRKYLELKDPGFLTKIENSLKSVPASPKFIDLEKHDVDTLLDIEKEEVNFKEDKLLEVSKREDENNPGLPGDKLSLLFEEQGLLEGKTPLLTKDNESIVLEVKLVVCFLPNKADNVFKFVNQNRIIKKYHLVNTIEKELSVRVFAPKLREHSAEELRVNPDIINKLQLEAENQLGEWLKDHGIKLIRLTISPSITDYEKATVLEKHKQALEELAGRQHERNLDKAEREFEILMKRNQLARELKKRSAELDENTEKIVRAAFLAEKDKKLSEAEFDAKITRLTEETSLELEEKKKELEFLGSKRNWDLEKEKLLTEAEIETDRKKTEAQIEIDKLHAAEEVYHRNKELKAKVKIEEIEKRKETAQIEQQHIEKVLEIGANSGALDSNALSESLRQASIRKAIDEGDTAVSQAFANAEGQRHSKESFKEGITNQQQIGIAGQGPYYLQTGNPLLQPGSQNKQNVLPNTSKGNGKKETDLMECQKCKKQIPKDSNICPYCEEKIIVIET